MEQRIIDTPDAPAAIGPYVQGRVVGGMLYSSGQIALDPKTGEMVGDDPVTQARQSLKNLGEIVKAAGGDLSSVVKCTVFVKNLTYFAPINAVYAEFFGEHKPARSFVEAARLPKDALVEIECIAAVG